MKLAIPALVLTALILSPLGSRAVASPVDGVWHSPDDNAEIELFDCGDKLCGRLLSSDHLKAHPETADFRNTNTALRSRQIKGLVIVSALSGGPTTWRGGKLYRPLDGHTYDGKLEVVDTKTLKVTGCVFAGLCDSQTWIWIRPSQGSTNR